MSEIIELFKSPPPAYRVQPFWFLNRGFDEAELRRQIAEMDDKGVGGAVLHCRHGLTIEYMSEDWLNMIGVCIDEMKARGMEAWLYDEDDWPSGTVGGRLTQPHPEYRMRYLRVQEMRINGGVTYQTRLQPDDNTLLAVQAWPYEETEEGLRLAPEPHDITEFYADGKLQWHAPLGKWLIAVLWECPVAERVTWDRGYYLDTMNPEAVNAFKSMAYEPYLRFREDFGATVKGIFTDEPGLMIHDGFFGVEAMRTTVEDPRGTLPGTIIAWTRDFLEKFEQLKGYDLSGKLLWLLYGSGPSVRKVRADYYDALVTWYIEAYHGNLSGWSREHGLQYIGHTLEDPLWGAARSQGNQIRVLEQFDRPGLDYLGHGVGTRENPFRILAAKCGSSVAHVQGKPRVMCEAFGGSGHGHTMADRKLDANFMACLGVNMYIPHAFYFSFQGFRKTDWPPTEFYHAPFWPWYRHFADYIARLSVFGSVGTHVSDACVLQPILTVQADMFADGHSVREPEAQQVFNEVSDLLLRLHHDYDYVDDSQLARAQVEDGRVKLPESAETYPCIVLPGCRVMSIAAARYLKTYFEAGGRLLALGQLPAECDDPQHDAELAQIISGIFGPGEEGQALRNDNEAGGIAIASPLRGQDLQLWLLQTMPQLVGPDVIVDDEERRPVEDIICCHRTTEGQELYLLVNRTKQDIEGIFRVRNEGLLQEWCLESGRVQTLFGAEKDEEGWLSYRVALDPSAALLLALCPDQRATPGLAPPQQRKPVTQIKLDPHWQFSAGGENVFILDKWTFVPRDTEAGPKHGVGIPGQVNTYRADFFVEARPEAIRLVLDDVEQNIPSHVGFLSRRRNVEIYVNDKQAPALEPSTWQDRYFSQADISDLVVEGRNRIQIVTLSLLEPFQHLNEPAYLVGDFSVLNDALVAPLTTIHGPFSQQGYPHFVGIATYRQTIKVPSEYVEGHQFILDPGDVFDCCRVAVNGQEVSVRLWPPYQVDITEAVRAGSNEIVVDVANSLTNLYDKADRTAGLSGPASVWVLR